MRAPVALTVDVHLHEHAAFAVDRDGLNSRLAISADAVRSIIDHAKAEGSKTLLIPGDWFHDRQKISVAVLDTSAEILAYARKQGVDVILVVGNHDLSREGNTNSVKGQRFADVIETPGVYKINGWKVGCVPWTDDPNEVRRVAKKPADFYVGHFGVSGTRVGPSDFEIPGHISPKVLRDKPMFLGHYHKPQDIPGTRALYIGSPVQQGWGESGEKKRFLVFSEQDVDSYTLDEFPRFVRTTPDKVKKCRPQDYIEVIASPDEVERTRNLTHSMSLNAHVIPAEIPQASPADMPLEGATLQEQLNSYAENVERPQGVSKEDAIVVAYELLGQGDADGTAS